MPRGISKAKHPELYGGKATNVTKLTTAKKGFGKGTQKLGAKAVAHTRGTETLNELSTYLTSLASLINQLPQDADKSVLFDEFQDVADIMIEERKKLFPNIEEETPAAAAPVQATPPAFVPPPAPGIQPHA